MTMYIDVLFPEPSITFWCWIYANVDFIIKLLLCYKIRKQVTISAHNVPGFENVATVILRRHKS